MGVIQMKLAIQVINRESGRGSKRIIIAMIKPNTAAIKVPTTVTNSVTRKNELSIVGRTSQAKSQRQKLVLSSMSGASTEVARPATRSCEILIAHLQMWLQTQRAYARLWEPETRFLSGWVLGRVCVFRAHLAAASVVSGPRRSGYTQRG